ncbi:YecH family metal-binding protein [Actomonas aquatica]|uniref:YecH family metal-binding protein n=1 Tax=Actomonas aquatica TaxID=2866162 RepID=A0ABZ1C9U2_9BACT|nr:YecH family metal-binding protein [Opitutus sp. WL0086]WRQ87354.1 YecH family metal-binding protein [Opitutus sp. WL0086]
MTPHIHGHEVMQMMLENSRSYTRQTLEAAIIERFGVETRYHTCSAENMTAAELVDFLESRGKFVAQDDGFTTSADKICQH